MGIYWSQLSPPKNIYDNNILRLEIALEFLSNWDKEHVEFLTSESFSELSASEKKRAKSMLTSIHSSFWKRNKSYIFQEVSRPTIITSIDQGGPVFDMKIIEIHIKGNTNVLIVRAQAKMRKNCRYNRKKIEAGTPLCNFVSMSRIQDVLGDAIFKTCASGDPVKIPSSKGTGRNERKLFLGMKLVHLVDE